MSVIKKDVISGFSVFLIALPLCLGIAMASNVPPVSGVIAAIVGGLISSWFGGAKLSIKGPAAGLIVISLSAVNELGAGDLSLGYKRALAVGVIAALLQIGLALSKRASMAEIMPPSVIHGMLAAIGVIIVSKQLYVMMGVSPTASKPLLLLFGLPNAFSHENPIIFFVGLLSLSIVLIWPLIKKMAFIPSAAVVIAVVIPCSILFNVDTAHDYSFLNHSYNVSSKYLLHLPNNFKEIISFPDFSFIFTLASMKYIIMFALVGSIESLLTVCAVDSMAPHAAPSDLNKDLLAVGIGNLISACIGGLPIISEIVRSKANIDYGAESNKSNFIHGLFLLVALLFLPSVMNLVMLSALAALLVYVGLTLASPKEFYHVYKLGWDQFAIFFITFIVTLGHDLLLGVFAGIAFKVIIHILTYRSFKTLFTPTINVKKNKTGITVLVRGTLTFVNYLILKNKLVALSEEGNHEIKIDLCGISFIDHTVLVKLKNIKSELPNIHFKIRKSPHLLRIYSDAPKSPRMRLGK